MLIFGGSCDDDVELGLIGEDVNRSDERVVLQYLESS